VTPPVPVHASGRPVRVLRRVFLAAAALSLALFAVSVIGAIHFNGNPASVRVGTRTVLGLASVLLPGPLLLAVCGWQSRYLFARIVGCVAAAPTLAACGYVAWITTMELRPLAAWGAYDAAAAEAESAALALVKANTDSALDVKAVRERWRQQPTARDELAGMALRVRAAVEGRRKGATSLLHLPEVVKGPFMAGGVSERRAAMFARLYLSRIDLGGVRAEEADFVAATEPFARGLELLVKHHGEWQWIDTESIVFDDTDIAREYEALINGGEPATR